MAEGNNPGLSVEIAVPIARLNRDFNSAVSIITNGTGDINNSINGVERSFTRINSTRFTFGANYASSARLVTTSSTQATNAVAATGTQLARSGRDYTNFGRVLQDLPFGFIGIQNNLTQLIPAVGLAGLAFSALVSAITFAQTGTSNWTRGLSDNKKTIDDVDKSTKEYLSTLNSVDRAQAQGQINATKDLAQLDILYKTTQNLSLSYSERKKAVDLLQEQYPKYFQNQRDEAILAGRTTDQYQKQRTAILEVARVKASEDLLSDNAKEEVVTVIQLTKQYAEYAKTRKQLAEVNARLPKDGGDTLALTDDQRLALSLEGKAIQQRGALIRLEKQRQQGLKDTADIIDAINKSVLKNGVDVLDLTPKTNGVKPDARPSKIEIKGSFVGVEKVNQQLEVFTEKIQEIGIEAPKIFSDFELLLIDFNDSVNDIVTNGLVSSFETLGSSLGDALANGTSLLDAFGQTLLSAVGDILIQFGKLSIAAGVASTALSKALTNPFAPGAGIAAIAAGVALVAIGSAVRGFSANIGGGSSSGSSSIAPRIIPGFANGVSNFGGGLALVGERGPEIVTLPTGSGVIPNHDLSNIGGKQDIILNGNLAVSMGQLVFEIDKYNSRKKRTG